MDTYWIFKAIDQPPIPITLVERLESGRVKFLGLDGALFTRSYLFLHRLDPLPPDDEEGDLGKLGRWWIGVPFSSSEKALEARSYAAKEAKESLQLRIQASRLQIKEDLEEIDKLDNLFSPEEEESIAEVRCAGCGALAEFDISEIEGEGEYVCYECEEKK